MFENSKFIINKSKLIKNLNALKTNNICAMVKADAYGHGLKNISLILKDKVKFFGVASLDEAILIRQSGIKTPVLVVGICNDIAVVLKNDISITIDNENQFFDILKRMDNTDKKLKIHIKINSGMNRLGINNIDEFKNILKALYKSKNIIFEGVFTHFATVGNDIAYFNKQLKVFNEFLKTIPVLYNPIKHLGGGDVLDVINIVDYKDFMFRVGLKLFVSPNSILKIESKIIKILDLPKGSRVGYSNGYICEKNTKIAVVPLGYADGINRKLANKGYVKIKNKKCQIVGNVCMDMFFADITNINCEIGDKVIVFENSKIWAKICDTIPYEILTNFKYSRMKYEIIQFN
ncbi:MAG: alanine racemase [Clostridia bacterium]|nr:alanine racemase [Clostridia bacterium]